MFPETSLLIWSQLLLMMFVLETMLKCSTRNFCLTARKMLPITLRGVYTVGKEILDQVNDRLRKLVDNSQNVQGFII